MNSIVLLLLGANCLPVALLNAPGTPAMIERVAVRPVPARAQRVRANAEPNSNSADLPPDENPLYFHNGKPAPRNPILPEHDFGGAFFQGKRFYTEDDRIRIYSKGSQRERYDLAGAYENGVGLDGLRNEIVAMNMYAQLDKEGYMPATANLADMYATGVNGGMTVTQDIPKAIELYSRVSQDALFVRGVHGLNLLAKEGHPEAMVRLGDFFAYNDAAKSLSLEQRWAYANKWYGKAAEAKYPAGLYLLGTGYRQMAMDQLRAGKVEAANKSSKDAKQALREAEDLGYDVNNDMWRKNLIRNEKASEIRGQKDF